MGSRAILSKLDGSRTVTALAAVLMRALVPSFWLMKDMMSAAVRPPLYASASLLPAGKYFRVGKPGHSRQQWWRDVSSEMSSTAVGRSVSM